MTRKKSKICFVGNARTLYKPVITPCIDPDDFAEAVKMFTERYYRTPHIRERINDTLRPVYGTEIPFSDHVIPDVVRKIRYIIDKTGENLCDIAQQLRIYTGENLRFFRRQGLREVPVEADRILQAYLAMKRKEPIGRVKFLLFK